MVIGVVGSTILAQNDMISRLLEIRKDKFRFWLHVVGQVRAYGNFFGLLSVS